MDKTKYTTEERVYLLDIARTFIHNRLDQVQTIPKLTNNKFSAQLSCLVSLHADSNELRGCTGSIIGYEPLESNVITNA